MLKSLKISWPDVIGIVSSSLCLVHCLAMPILIATGIGFLAYEWLTYVFLLVSFLSIYKASKNLKSLFIGGLLWFSFFGLLLSTFFHDLNEWVHYLNYFFALTIVLGHILNMKYCKHCE